MRKLVASVLLLSWLPLFGAETNTDEAKREKFLTAARAIESKLHFQKGTVSLKNDLATLSLPEKFRYLPPDDADTVLVKLWGNPPGEKTLGMVVPADQSVLSDEGWAVII